MEKEKEIEKIDYNLLKLRTGTWDRNIFRSVAELNEYNLTEFSPEDYIIDIGTHVGGFCWACAMRGAKNIDTFEASSENFTLAWQNVEVLKNLYPDLKITANNFAVYRSDMSEELVDKMVLHFSGINGENTGGGNVLHSTEGEEVKCKRLDSIIGDKQVDLLKLDCEGSEFPILLTSKKLSQVKKILGEFHEGDAPQNLNMSYDKFTMVLLKEHLEAEGFEVTYEHHKVEPRLGLFTATRK
jgi:FkbM family methyltransferase